MGGLAVSIRDHLSRGYRRKMAGEEDRTGVTAPCASGIIAPRQRPSGQAIPDDRPGPSDREGKLKELGEVDLAAQSLELLFGCRLVPSGNRRLALAKGPRPRCRWRQTTEHHPANPRIRVRTGIPRPQAGL